MAESVMSLEDQDLEISLIETQEPLEVQKNFIGKNVERLIGAYLTQIE